MSLKHFLFLSCIVTTMMTAMVVPQANADCGHAGLEPGDYTRHIISGGRKRSYNIHVPASTKGTKAPLVLNFHGGGGNAQNQEEISGMSLVADAKGFIVAYPNGTGILKSRFLSFNAGMCCGYAKENNVDDVTFVRDMLKDIEANFCIDINRVFSTGFSNGAIMSHRLGCELADRIAAIAPVAGPIGIDNCNPSRPVPVLEFHGTADPMAPYHGGLKKAVVGREKHLYRSMKYTIAGWAQRNGCVGKPQKILQQGAVTCERYGSCGAPVTLCTIEGGGHTWPGGISTLSERVAGPVNDDISAAEMIWRFFERHSLQSQL